MKQIALFSALMLMLVMSSCGKNYDFTVDGLNYAINPNTELEVTIMGHDGKVGKNLEIKPSVSYENKTYIVTAIGGKTAEGEGEGAFEGCSDLQNVRLPNCMTSIGAGAFAGCTKLETINIPYCVVKIGAGAFEGCEKIKQMVVDPKNPVYQTVKGKLTYRTAYYSVETQGEYKDEFGDFDEITMSSTTPKPEADAKSAPEKVVNIKNQSTLSSADFTSPEVVEVVNIPASVTTITANAFDNCKNLKEINVDKGNTFFSSVDGVLFCNGGKTLVYYPLGKTGTSYAVPAGVTEIGFGAFFRAPITEITIPEGVTAVRNSAFQASKIVNIVLPKSVTKVGVAAFRDCVDLQSIDIQGNIGEIRKSTFYQCSRLMKVNYANGVTKIGEWAFGHCQNLREVSMPASLKEIEQYAFYNCLALAGIKVPANVTKVGYDAFHAVKNITLMKDVK